MFKQYLSEILNFLVFFFLSKIITSARQFYSSGNRFYSVYFIKLTRTFVVQEKGNLFTMKRSRCKVNRFERLFRIASRQ